MTNMTHWVGRAAVIAAALFLSLGSAFAEEAARQEIGVLKPNGVRHVTVEEAKDLLDANPHFKVLDVRTGGEYGGGHIAGALNINYFSLNFRKKIRELDKSATYVVHCKSGHRSGRAAPIMKEEGIDAVIHMDGGFDAWKDAGFPVEQDDA